MLNDPTFHPPQGPTGSRGPRRRRAGASQASPSKFGAPEAYTPKHLAEKILASESTLEDERKQVTVLFADMKGSMELLADRDPEEARKLLDPVLEHMMEAVHRYEGTVNQVMGDGIIALSLQSLASLTSPPEPGFPILSHSASHGGVHRAPELQGRL
jgi:class 3 adenylate cyclase